MPSTPDTLPRDRQEQRRQLLFLRDQARAACAALRNEREKYKKYVAETTIELNAARAAIAAGQEQLAAQRRRLLRLYRRIKERTQRQCQAQRQALQDRLRQLAAWEAELQRLGQSVYADKEELGRARVRFNGEREVARRQLQIGWKELRDDQRRSQASRAREQAALQERHQELAARATDQESAARELDEQRRHWGDRLRALQAEAEGLERRIIHQRARLAEQETELHRLESEQHGVRAGPAPVAVSVALAPLPADVADQIETRERALRQAETTVAERLSALEELAGELDDQRRQLIEHVERWRQARQLRQDESTALAGEWEAVAGRLREREQALEATGRAQRERQELLDGWHKQLQVQQAQLEVRRTAWECERERLLTELGERDALPTERPAAPLEQDNYQLQWKILCLRAQRETYTRQIRTLNEEVERLAHALIGDDSPDVPFPVARAA